ncbi:MAG: PD-(D/E)XK nuclease family protein [Gammaproteobacteria bacterium]
MSAVTPATGEILAGGGTVITATHRLARTLRLEHDRSRAAAGLTVWPGGDILPLDAWIRRGWDAAVVQATAAGARRLLSEEESRLLWRRVIAAWAEHSGNASGDVGVLVPLASSGWRLCQTWGISAAELQAAADSDDARAFSQWVNAYQRLLQEGQWLDMAGAMQALTADISSGLLSVPGQIGWMGFDPWPPAHATLSNALTAAGCAVERLWPAARSGTVRILSCRDEADELVQAAYWARQRLTESPGATVAVIVPELPQRAAAVRRSLLEILAPGWQLHPPSVPPLSLSGGWVLADYPVVAAALRLLQSSTAEPDFQLASLVLRSTYSRGATVEQAGRAELELWLRNAPAGHISRELLVAGARKRAPQLAASFDQAAALLGEPGRRLMASQWSALFARVLEAHGWPGERGLDSEEFQAAGAWQGLLQSWASFDEVIGSTTLQAALAGIRSLASERPFVPEASPEGLQVLSLEEAAGQTFDHLWVCGMTAERWPPAPHAHALVPLQLQRAAGIPAAAPATLQSWTGRRLSRLLTGADDVVLSWASRRGDAELLMSPLLATVSVTAISEEPDSAAAEANPDRHRVSRSAQPETVAVDLPPAWPAGQHVRGGARVLSLQAVCPARAFIEARLCGTELRQPSRPLDPATRGNLLHKLLERLYGHEECQQGLAVVLPSRLSELFSALIEGVLDDCLPRTDVFLRRLRELERERLWSQLMALAVREQEWGAFRTETETPRSLDIGSLALELRLDRIDSFADGAQLVIDYKTGSFKAKAWRTPRLEDCQLPLYAVTTGCQGVAVLQFTPSTVVVYGVGDPALGLDCLKTPGKFFDEPELDWNGAVSRWRGQLEVLAAEFASGDFRVDPAKPAPASGQFAVLTGVHSAEAAEEDSE